MTSYLLIPIISFFLGDRTRFNQILQGLEDDFGFRLRSRHIRTLTFVISIIIPIQLILKSTKNKKAGVKFGMLFLLMVFSDVQLINIIKPMNNLDLASKFRRRTRNLLT